MPVGSFAHLPSLYFRAFVSVSFASVHQFKMVYIVKLSTSLAIPHFTTTIFKYSSCGCVL